MEHTGECGAAKEAVAPARKVLMVLVAFAIRAYILSTGYYRRLQSAYESCTAHSGPYQLLGLTDTLRMRQSRVQRYLDKQMLTLPVAVINVLL